MTDHDQDNHLDELLDSALSAYSEVEPRPGLETRILANLREAAGKQPSPWWNWKALWVGAVTAVAILLGALLLSRHSRTPAPANEIVHTHAPAQTAPRGAGNVPSTARHAQDHRSKMRAPFRPQSVALKLDRRPPVFPTPTPLSEQERLLLSYYAHTPREELIAQSHPEEPPLATEDQSNIAVPEIVFVPQKSSNTR